MKFVLLFLAAWLTGSCGPNLVSQKLTGSAASGSTPAGATTAQSSANTPAPGNSGGITGGRIAIFFDSATPQHAFAAQEMKSAFERRGVSVDLQALSTLAASGPTRKVVLADLSNTIVQQLMQKEGAPAPGTLGAQAYTLKTTGTGDTLSYWAIGGDPAGTMYGGLQLAENVDGAQFGAVIDASTTPFISQRGIKFNIPLDARTPSYADNSDSAQANIVEMWSMDFWTAFLDQMARHRYNVLSLWSLSPFPSLVKVKEYPNASLSDVKTAGSKGTGNAATVKTMTIDEKITLWRNVMQHAQNRGIKFYIFTWNIFANGTENSGYGITSSPTNTTTVAYVRAAVRTLFQTYPLLAGIGVTAGENMQGASEQWMWDTYGQGFTDAQALEPGRDMRFIHRTWMTSPSGITALFNKLPGASNADSTLSVSFKYSQAHMLSSTKPLYINSFLGTLPAGMKTWLTVRTDDMFVMRWGDPDYARAYIKNMPSADKLAGFYMGPDGYTWGREILSKNPTTPRQLFTDKMWYGFHMWGKLAFDPTTVNSDFQQSLGARYPSVSAAALFNGFASVSKIVPLITRFYWGDMDYMWYPEACWSSGSFNTVNDFMNGKYTPMGSNDGDSPGLLSIKQSLAGSSAGKLTAMDVAAALQKYADDGAAAIASLQAGTNTELAETLGDINAMAHLGRYYAEKILGAVELAKGNHQGAVTHLTTASSHWKSYAAQLTSQYVAGQVLGRLGGSVDFNAIQSDVDNDIKIAGGP